MSRGDQLAYFLKLVLMIQIVVCGATRVLSSVRAVLGALPSRSNRDADGRQNLTIQIYYSQWRI